MTLALIVPVVFLLLELSNVLTLYFWPGSTRANGMGVFKAWEISKADPQVHAMVRYLTWWVAGTKLIFIAMLCTVLALGPPQLQAAALVAMVASIGTFYWRLFPTIRRLDREGQLTVPGYSSVLGAMIAVFMVALAAAAWGLFS